MLRAFKGKYEEVLCGNDCRLRIVASIGKQSKGKSYFMGKVFGENIPNKHGMCVDKGTDILFWVRCRNFLLLDMEGLEGKKGTEERDMLNFVVSFTLANVVLLHISHDDLENSTFIENFSYGFWQSSILSCKLNATAPKIILLIRDPRISKECKETVFFYKELVKKFERMVNQKVKEYENEHYSRAERVLSQSAKSEEDKANVAKRLTDLMAKKIEKFFIDAHFCIYFVDSFKKGIKYCKMNNEFCIVKSNFEEIFSLVSEYCITSCSNPQSPQSYSANKYWGVNSPLSQRIHQMLLPDISNNRHKIFEIIYFEVKYNLFSHFRNFFGYLRLMEKYYFKALKLEKIEIKIRTSIDQNSPDLKIRKLREDHGNALEKYFTKHLSNPEHIEYIKNYLKYCSTLSFCETFRFDPGYPFSTLYQKIENIFRSDTEDKRNKELVIIEKSLKGYQCLVYYNQEFVDMVNLILQPKFKFYQALFGIYQRRIDYHLHLIQEYSDLNKIYSGLTIENYEDLMNKILLLLGQKKNFLQVNQFLSDLKELHKFLMLQKIHRPKLGNSIVYSRLI